MRIRFCSFGMLIVSCYDIGDVRCFGLFHYLIEDILHANVVCCNVIMVLMVYLWNLEG